MNHVTATDKTKLYVKYWGSGRHVILIHGWPLLALALNKERPKLLADFFRTLFGVHTAKDPSSQPLDVPNSAHRALQVIILGWPTCFVAPPCAAC